MKLDRKEYRALCKEQEPSSPSRRTVPAAFAVGGTLCLLGQVLRTLYQNAGLDEKAVGTAVSVSLILLGVALTALGLFEKIAKFAGAGTLVPITGFANSIAAPAVEFRTEGYVLGVGGKMFQIAGPVIVYGVSASVIYGFIYWLWCMI